MVHIKILTKPRYGVVIRKFYCETFVSFCRGCSNIVLEANWNSV